MPPTPLPPTFVPLPRNISDSENICEPSPHLMVPDVFSFNSAQGCSCFIFSFPVVRVLPLSFSAGLAVLRTTFFFFQMHPISLFILILCGVVSFLFQVPPPPPTIFSPTCTTADYGSGLRAPAPRARPFPFGSGLFLNPKRPPLPLFLIENVSVITLPQFLACLSAVLLFWCWIMFFLEFCFFNCSFLFSFPQRPPPPPPQPEPPSPIVRLQQPPPSFEQAAQTARPLEVDDEPFRHFGCPPRLQGHSSVAPLSCSFFPPRCFTEASLFSLQDIKDSMDQHCHPLVVPLLTQLALFFFCPPSPRQSGSATFQTLCSFFPVPLSR